MKSIIVLTALFFGATNLYAEEVPKKKAREIDIVNLKKGEPCVRLTKNKKIGGEFVALLNCKENGEVTAVSPTSLPRYFDADGEGGFVETSSKISVD